MIKSIDLVLSRLPGENPPHLPGSKAAHLNESLVAVKRSVRRDHQMSAVRHRLQQCRRYVRFGCQTINSYTTQPTVRQAGKDCILVSNTAACTVDHEQALPIAAKNTW